MSKKDAVVKNDPKSQEKWYNNIHTYMYIQIHIHIYEQGHLGLKLVVKFSKDVLFLFFKKDSQIFIYFKTTSLI
jgi:hypothetical protein